jgi:exodeoxyribonuclease V alpha subunit
MNLQHYLAESAAAIQRGVVDCLHDLHSQGLDPVWDCQVLVPLNEKSEVSRKKINAILQGELNTSPRVGNSPFRVGDKVVCLANGYLPAVEKPNDANVVVNHDGDIYVANGEIGRVAEVVDGKWWVMAMDSPRRVVKALMGKSDSGTKSRWDLAYALSVHKSQGSEWPVVLVVIDESGGASRLCDRSWIYTAISRAKQKCVLIGKLSTAQRMARRVSLDRRKTFLAQLIKEESRGQEETQRSHQTAIEFDRDGNQEEVGGRKENEGERQPRPALLGR